MSKSMYCVGKILGGNITMIVASDKAINENIKQGNVIRANKREWERG